MSKLAPRNASVVVVESDDADRVIRKRYHAEYTATQEEAAYKRVCGIYRSCEGIRCANVLSVEDGDLFIEYIPGENLYESAADGRFGPLRAWQGRLVTAFVHARTMELSFDSDPSNYIVHDETNELVAVDPVCKDIQLPDFAAVIFLWGILKLILRSIKFWRYPELYRIACSFLVKYLEESGTSEVQIRDQLVTYIDVVIGWNKEVSRVDGLLMIVVRRAIAIPIYSVAKFAIRRGVIRFA